METKIKAERFCQNKTELNTEKLAFWDQWQSNLSNEKTDLTKLYLKYFQR